MLSQKLDVSPTSCHGYIIGEHGDSSIPVWSSVNVAGVRLREIKPTVATPDDEEHLGDVHQEVVNAAYTVIKLKGYTSWAIGLSVSQLVQSIFNDTSSIHAVSVSVKGHHGVNDEVFMSLPATLKVLLYLTKCRPFSFNIKLFKGSGVSEIVKLNLSDHEKTQFQKSAALLKTVTETVQL